MRITAASALLPSLILIASPAWAQAEGEPDPAAQQDAKAPPPPEDAGTKFAIRRGFYAETDLGIFLTFGGRNTNDVTLPPRSTSNIQPYLGLTFAYDLVHSDAFSFSLGIKLGAGYTSGAGRVSESDIQSYGADILTTRPSDFALLEVGVVAGVSVMLTDRLALTFKVDGGMGAGDPHPLSVGTPNNANGLPGPAAGFGAALGGGLGIEYFTLLNDFSVGLDARFAAALIDTFIPGLSVTIPIKYTF